MICYLYPEPLYFFFSSEVPALLYYAHVPTILVSLLIGLYVLWNGRQFLLNRLLFAISFIFALWATINLIAWTNIHSDFILFVWSFNGLLLGLISIFCVYFTYVFLDKKDVSVRLKTIFFVLIAPIILFAPTYLNFSGFNIAACDAFKFEGTPFKFYYTLLGVLAMVWIFALLVRRYRSAMPDFKKQIILMGTGIESFLFLFFVMITLASYLTQTGVLQNSEIELYGLFGVVIFIAYIGILVVRFGFMNLKILGAQALTAAIWVLVGALFFLSQGTTNHIVTGVTFALSVVLGIKLIQSVKKEVEQRERIEKLAVELAAANEKLKELDKLKSEFLSLASHQLRSPLTAIKGYTSMMLEGTFGELSVGVKEVTGKVFESAQSLINMVEDFLSVSKIEQGGMQYVFEPTDLSKLVKTLYGEMKIVAENKQLEFALEMAEGDSFMVNGDGGKLKQVLLNLVDNSIKYTPNGFVHLSLSRDSRKNTITFAVKDSGVGISPETKEKLFGKFSRGEGGKLNTGGSGLGLYLAREITKAHKGNVVIDSEGLGKGSTFSVTLPALAR